MLNLVRMNFYRMAHTRCMYVLLIITMIFAVFSVSTIKASVEMMEEGELVGDTMEDQFVAGMEDGMEADVQGADGVEREATGVTMTNGDETTELSFGIYSEPPIQPDGTITSFIAYLFSDISSGIILMFLSIATVLFVNGESKTGFIKNIAVNTKTRVGIYCSKVIAMFGYTLICTVAFAIVEYISLMIYYKGDVEFGMDVLADNGHIFLLQLLLHLAFICGLVLLTTVTKSSTIGITIGMLTITGFASFFITPIERLFDIKIAKYTIHNNLLNVDFGAGNELLTTALIVGIVTVIVYNVIGNIWVARRDVV